MNEGAGACDEGMDVEEFLTWAAYFAIEPPAELRADIHTAMLMAQQYNMNRGRGKPVKKPSDFMPRYTKGILPRGRRPKTASQMRLAAQRQFMALGGDPEEIRR